MARRLARMSATRGRTYAGTGAWLQDSDQGWRANAGISRQSQGLLDSLSVRVITRSVAWGCRQVAQGRMNSDCPMRRHENGPSREVTQKEYPRPRSTGHAAERSDATYLPASPRAQSTARRGCGFRRSPPHARTATARALAKFRSLAAAPVATSGGTRLATRAKKNPSPAQPGRGHLTDGSAARERSWR